MNDRLKFRAGFKVCYYDEDGNDKELLIKVKNCFSIANGGDAIIINEDVIKGFIKDLSTAEQNSVWEYMKANFDETNDFWLIDKLEYLDQCTDFKDRYSRLIYEEDIIKIPNDWEKYGFLAGTTREVIFNSGGFRVKPQFNQNSRGNWLEDTEEFEIIGNIHENKELLK